MRARDGEERIVETMRREARRYKSAEKRREDERRGEEMGRETRAVDTASEHTSGNNR